MLFFFEGGNTYHLMRWINKSGLGEILPQLLKTKIYVGVSAGSMVACKDLALKISQIVYEEDLDETEELAGLSLVDFYFIPHLNSEYFKKLRIDNIKGAVQGKPDRVYAMDDNSALKVVDGKVEVISEGEWFLVN